MTTNIQRPYGFCTISGPAEDVAFVLRHLPDIDDVIAPAQRVTPDQIDLLMGQWADTERPTSRQLGDGRAQLFWTISVDRLRSMISTIIAPTPAQPVTDEQIDALLPLPPFDHKVMSHTRRDEYFQGFEADTLRDHTRAAVRAALAAQAAPKQTPSPVRSVALLTA